MLLGFLDDRSNLIGGKIDCAASNRLKLPSGVKIDEDFRSCWRGCCVGVVTEGQICWNPVIQVEVLKREDCR